MASTDDFVNAILGELKGKHFYGVLELHFQEGRIVRIKKTETILPTDPEVKRN